ncbi:hypothetical protein, partial [Alistipes putredinis]|uniref:hypothetical protein n=1 Tax=Alistipes putredinis TaxID=28117 RepID=UPI003AB60F61
MPFLKIREQFTAIILCAKNFLIDSGPIYCNNDSIFSKISFLLRFLPAAGGVGRNGAERLRPIPRSEHPPEEAGAGG